MRSRFATVVVLSFAAVAVGGEACVEGEDSCQGIGDIGNAMVQVKLSKTSGHLQAEEELSMFGQGNGWGEDDWTGETRQQVGCAGGHGVNKGWGIPFDKCALSCVQSSTCKVFAYGQRDATCMEMHPKVCRCWHYDSCASTFAHQGYNIYSKPANGPTRQFSGGGRSYSDSQQLCRQNGLNLCPKWRICPFGHHNPPVDGQMHGDIWIPIADSSNDWVQIGNGGHILCAGHVELGYGYPSWGHGHNSYNQRIFCCN